MPIKITVVQLIVALYNKSRVNNITIAGLDCTAFEVLSRKALHFKRGRKGFTFSPNPRVQHSIYYITIIYIG